MYLARFSYDVLPINRQRAIEFIKREVEAARGKGLSARLAAGKTEWRLAFRAQIILALADGLTNKAAAGRLATRPATVSKWRGRFARDGLAGVADAPRSGKPRHYDAEDERRILGALDAPPPAGYARWNGTLLASIWAISPSTRSGGCCGSTRSRWSGGGAGASAPIRRSHRRPPTLSRSICSLRRTPWCSRWTRSPTSRPWSAPKAG